MTTRTKGYIVDEAFNLLAISGLTTVPTAGEVERALNRLEDMMYELQSRNICSSYVFEDFPDANTESGIHPAFTNAASTNVAARIASSYGRPLTGDIALQARQSMSNWSARTARVNPINPPSRQPRGSGNTFRWQNWYRYYRIEDNAPISCSTLEIKVDEINGFIIDFSLYLKENEVISSYTKEVTNGLELLADSNTDTTINLEQVKGVQGGYNTILLTITTDLGRVNPHVVNFNVTQ
jgi:hypothetical protein